ncbi:MAG: TIGR00268 family protein [Cyanobacteria bacterium PR.3.49]|nr:TIGR00268 family protein [Cyanobacteria bacterium PR.3.49]
MPAVTDSRLAQREKKLIDSLARLENVVVAYSGGVDSSLLAYYARKTLGARAKIVIAISPSLAADELDEAREQARLFDWQLIEVKTYEVDNPEYRKNDGQRCYFCKGALFEAMNIIAEAEGFKALAYGANIADLADLRPGHRAAREYKVLSPLQEAELTKEEIRQLAKTAGLPAWDKPQSACLSSRFPTFETVTPARLKIVEAAEMALRKLGLKGFRVRFHSLNTSEISDSKNGKDMALARIELSAEDLRAVLEIESLRSDISAAVKSAGFAFVTIDLEGYRQGSSNIETDFVKVELKGRG